ncbi:hypothetical protein [Nocardioides montaniterrae]
MRTPTRRIAAAVTLGLGAAGSWWAWLGWDHTYQRNAAGQWHGPYETWQVIGCAGTLLAVALLGAIRVHPLTLMLMPIAFTAAWVQTVVATTDPVSDDGMWVAGAIMVLIGTTFGAVVIGGVATVIRSGKESRDGLLR